MIWNGKKVLVTGAGGFIGSHLTERLVREGAQVTAFVRYNSRGDRGSLKFLPQEILSEIKVEVGDLKDPFAAQKIARKQEIVFHLAALIGIPYSYVNPIDYVQTNALGTSYLLQACREENIEKFIHTSTSEVYGTAQYVPIDENHPLQGQSPYSASKIAADQMALSFHRAFEMPVAVIRPFNTYGPRQSARAVIPTIIYQGLKSDRIKLGSLSPKRDLNFVGDTVEGFIRMAESPKSIGEVINVGSSKEITIGELAEKISGLLGKQQEVVGDSDRVRPKASEVGRLQADIQKAKEILNWEPRTSLTEGLTQTIEWVKEQMSFFPDDSYQV